MFIIDCPWCGKRDQSEFTAHGEAHISRPQKTASLSEEKWGEYVFFRKNTKGVHYERWVHAHGCRRWFNVVRNTLTDEIHGSYQITDAIPTITSTQPTVQSKTDTDNKGSKS